MKTKLLSISILILTLFAHAQIPKLKWAKSMGGSGQDYGYSIALDTYGNVYTIGRFAGTADFDPGAATFNLVSVNGSIDFFITKLDANGNFLWAKSWGNGSDDIAYAATTDAMGNIYITGLFGGTIDFDSGPGIFNLSSGGTSDIFILKLDAAGNFVMARKMGGSLGDMAYGIAIDASGNIYTTGQFSGTADFDPGTGVSNLTATGYCNIFISKLDALGNYVWAANLDGALEEGGYSVTVDKSGDVITTGTFSGTVDFDPGPGTFTLTAHNVSMTDIFISKLDAAGNFVWAKAVGSYDYDNGYAIAADAFGNIYTTGQFSSVADFDPSNAGTFNLTSAGNSDIFILKLDVNGNFVWAKRIGGPGNDIGSAVTVDASGNPYFTGVFDLTVDFDPNAATYFLSCPVTSGLSDVFLLKLDSSGKFVWAGNMGGTKYDKGNSLAVSASGNVFTTGSFEGTADFDPDTTVLNITTAGQGDIFIHKMSQIGFGINGYAIKDQPGIYPNPTNGDFIFQLAKHSTNARIEIYNSLGALIYNQTNLEELNSIDITNEANGMYFVKVMEGENEIAAGKLVKN